MRGTNFLKIEQAILEVMRKWLYSRLNNKLELMLLLSEENLTKSMALLTKTKNYSDPINMVLT
jgi:hypothetical protein